MKSTLDTIAFFKNIRPTLDAMSDADAGALIKALFAHDDGEEVDMASAAPMVQAIYPLVVESMDRLSEYRAKKSKAGKTTREQIRNKKGTDEEQNGNITETHNHNHNHSHNHTSSEEDGKVRRCTPPTAEQVNEYATKFGMKIDAQRFVDFYSSKGWKVGSSPMKDWQAAVRNWVSRDKKGKKDDKSDLINQLIAHTYGEAST